MTVVEAQQIVRDYFRKQNCNPSEEEFFMFTEAMDFLIQETKDPAYMVDLGAVYYENRQFDLALKYYEMAAEYGEIHAISNLGYIWYYGRTGEKNYEKAFYYFNKASEMGDIIAAYKVADMYKNGYYVEKDETKYKELIEELYPKVKEAQFLSEPLPEIFTRLARIRTDEGRTDEALELYDVARDFQAQRLRMNPFFGDLNIMKWMIRDIYKLRPFDKDYMDLYDLYYLLQSPSKITFMVWGRKFAVEAVQEEDGIAIKFDHNWYRTVDDFFQKAEIEDELLTTIYDELYDFEVISNG